jgi:hypothetical protein
LEEYDNVSDDFKAIDSPIARLSGTATMRASGFQWLAWPGAWSGCKNSLQSRLCSLLARFPPIPRTQIPPARPTWDNVIVQATVELRDAILRQLEMLAKQEGATPADPILRLIEAHEEQCNPPVQRTIEVHLPLIAASETGPIQPVTGRDVDEVFSRDHSHCLTSTCG